MNQCIDCGKEISKLPTRCRSCSKKGKNNPNYAVKMSEKIKEKIRETKIGEKNPMWKGNEVGYMALHEYVRKHFPKPKKCMECSKKTKFLDLANKGIYNRDLINWEYLCRKCHMTKDGRLDTLHDNNKK
jgi:DNA-directed RNA polymerase subunit RPC12/RpoP